jgi:hypothetical protein
MKLAYTMIVFGWIFIVDAVLQILFYIGDHYGSIGALVFRVLLHLLIGIGLLTSGLSRKEKIATQRKQRM